MENPKAWLDYDENKYNEMYSNREITHNHFIKWVKFRTEITTALEIGGGYSKHKDLFQNYTSIEINQKIKASYIINSDFMNYKEPKKYDLVFSHAVIDHIKRPNEFILKSIKLAKKWVYHSIYRGCVYSSKHQKPTIDRDGYLYNNLSLYELDDLLKNYNHTLKSLPNNNLLLIVKI